jgi:hypothetical protein
VSDHCIYLTERERRAIVSALEIARDQTINTGWRWWHATAYAVRLYDRLRGQAL